MLQPDAAAARRALEHIDALGARADNRDILPIWADASTGIPHRVGLAPKLTAGISAAIAAILDNLIHDATSVSLLLISAGLLPADGARPGTAYAVAPSRLYAVRSRPSASKTWLPYLLRISFMLRLPR